LKSTETERSSVRLYLGSNFSNFGSLKSTETERGVEMVDKCLTFQQFRLVEEH